MKKKDWNKRKAKRGTDKKTKDKNKKKWLCSEERKKAREAFWSKRESKRLLEKEQLYIKNLADSFGNPFSDEEVERLVKRF